MDMDVSFLRHFFKLHVCWFYTLACSINGIFFSYEGF